MKLDQDAIRAEAMDFANVGIYRYRYDGSIVFMDRGSLRLLDIEDRYPDPRVLVGEDIGSLFEHIEEPGTLRRAVSERGRVHGFEYHFRTLTGKERWVWHNSYEVRDPDGGEKAIQVIAQDITALKRATVALKAEVELRQERERQMFHAQKLESLGVMAGGLAHDFNNLLFAIMGHADMAEMKLDDPDAASEQLHYLSEAAEQAARLCQQLLAYAGRGNVQMRPIEPNSLIRGSVELISISISRMADLRLELAGKLSTIRGDPAQIRQAILNLVINASEALGDGPGFIEVSTGMEDCTTESLREMLHDGELTAGQYVRISVRDDGQGMDGQTMHQIFDPFYTTKFTGRGLGLASVLGIVNSHRGAIRVESEMGQGSCFTLVFPASDAKVEDDGTTGTEPIGWAGNGLVLVADDDPHVLRSLEIMLGDLGFDVVTATNGKRAVEKFRELAPKIRLVVLDVTMPRMGGIEAGSEIRAIDPSVPLLVSSGYNQQDLSEKMKMFESAKFIRKPYRIRQLRRVLRTLLG